MSNFMQFKHSVRTRFESMGTDLYVVDIDKEVLWNLYLDSFPEGTNEIYKERRQYDCQCCRQFIRAIGDVVAIKGGDLVSIWDVEVQGEFRVVTEALSDYIKSRPIKDVFFHYEGSAGTDNNHQQLENGSIKQWDHLHTPIHKDNVLKADKIASKLGDLRESKNVFKRGLDEITLESLETIRDLVSQGSLYRGEEHLPQVQKFLVCKEHYNNVVAGNHDTFAWKFSQEHKQVSRFRNTVIGTLATDLSDGMDLEKAVKRFEDKVAPQNYKRPTTLITQGMIKKAQEKVEELGIKPALDRRFAVVGDLTINNVLYADNSAKEAMDVFDELSNEVAVSTKSLDKVEKVTVESFFKDVLPTATSIEMLVENKHVNNLVSLIAPVNEAKNILKWGNNFSWSYNGEVTDSIKERVKNAGGNVDGVLRFSIMWNEDNNNQDDLDAHCIQPIGSKIFFSNKRVRHPSSGMLDVDIQSPGNEVAVENIVYTDAMKMPVGDYQFLVHNYNKSGGTTGGFTAEVVYKGDTYQYSYSIPLKHDQKVPVATVNWDGTKFSIKDSLPSSTASKEVWGINTHTYQKVSMIMNSPNHWDGEETGNKHWFFMLEGCKNPERARGFYNEFLNNDLTEHRKVFEVLGSKMKTELSDDQLSGVGLSSTVRNSVFLKLTGNFNRTIEVLF